MASAANSVVLSVQRWVTGTEPKSLQQSFEASESLKSLADAINDNDEDVITECELHFVHVIAAVVRLHQTYSRKLAEEKWEELAVNVLILAGTLANRCERLTKKLLQHGDQTAAVFKLLRLSSDSSIHGPAVVATAAGMLCLFKPVPPADPGLVAMYLESAYNALVCCIRYPDNEHKQYQEARARAVAGEQGVWLLDRTVRKAMAHTRDPRKMFLDAHAAASPSGDASLAPRWTAWPAALLQVMLHDRCPRPRQALLGWQPLDTRADRLLDQILPCAHACLEVYPGIRLEMASGLQIGGGSGLAVILQHLSSTDAATVSGAFAIIAAVLRLLGPVLTLPACKVSSSSARVSELLVHSYQSVPEDLAVGAHTPLWRGIKDMLAAKLWPAEQQASWAGQVPWTSAQQGGKDSSRPTGGQPSLFELVISCCMLTPCVASSSVPVPGAQLAVLAVLRDAGAAMADAIRAHRDGVVGKTTGAGAGASSSSSSPQAAVPPVAAMPTCRYLCGIAQAIYDKALKQATNVAHERTAVLVRAVAVHTIVCISSDIAHACRPTGHTTAEAHEAAEVGIQALLEILPQEVTHLAAIFPNNVDSSRVASDYDMDEDSDDAGAAGQANAVPDPSPARLLVLQAICHAFTIPVNDTYARLPVVLEALLGPHDRQWLGLPPAAGDPPGPRAVPAAGPGAIGAGAGSGAGAGAGSGAGSSSSTARRPSPATSGVPSSPHTSPSPPFDFHSAFARLRPAVGMTSACPVRCPVSLMLFRTNVLPNGRGHGGHGRAAGAGAVHMDDDDDDDGGVADDHLSSVLGCMTTLVRAMGRAAGSTGQSQSSSGAGAGASSTASLLSFTAAYYDLVATTVDGMLGRWVELLGWQDGQAVASAGQIDQAAAGHAGVIGPRVLETFSFLVDDTGVPIDQSLRQRLSAVVDAHRDGLWVHGDGRGHPVENINGAAAVIAKASSQTRVSAQAAPSAAQFGAVFLAAALPATERAPAAALKTSLSDRTDGGQLDDIATQPAWLSARAAAGQQTRVVEAAVGAAGVPAAAPTAGAQATYAAPGSASRKRPVDEERRVAAQDTEDKAVSASAGPAPGANKSSRGGGGSIRVAGSGAAAPGPVADRKAAGQAATSRNRYRAIVSSDAEDNDDGDEDEDSGPEDGKGGVGALAGPTPGPFIGPARPPHMAHGAGAVEGGAGASASSSGGASAQPAAAQPSSTTTPRGQAGAANHQSRLSIDGPLPTPLS